MIVHNGRQVATYGVSAGVGQNAGAELGVCNRGWKGLS